MISEDEIRDMQEEMGEMREALDRLAAMNEALQEALFATLQSTPVQQELFADVIDRTLDQWPLQHRRLDSADALFLRRVRDDVLAKLQEGSPGFLTAKSRPVLRAVPLLRPSEAAPKPEAVLNGAENSPPQVGTPLGEQPAALLAPEAESTVERDE